MKILPVLLAGLLPIAAFAAPSVKDTMLFGGEDKLHVVVNNRVLARVNGKPISVFDVMKKMDMVFLKQFPQFTSSPSARYQFYNANWKGFLSELIDKELILAEAEEVKMEVSGGDVRQEMESMFGPNIIANLDKIGLGFDEAFKIVQGDIILRRMMYMRVNNKAIRGVTPQEIRLAYEAYSKEHQKDKGWRYQVISIRHPDATIGAEVAQHALALLNEDKIPLDSLVNELKPTPPMNVNVSETIFHTDKEIAEVLNAQLTKLQPGEYSPPLAQKSRTDKSTVFRILFLKENVDGGAPLLSEVEANLKDQLIDLAIEKESVQYLKKLRSHFDFNESQIAQMAPEDFQPFALK